MFGRPTPLQAQQAFGRPPLIPIGGGLGGAPHGRRMSMGGPAPMMPQFGGGGFGLPPPNMRRGRRMSMQGPPPAMNNRGNPFLEALMGGMGRARSQSRGHGRASSENRRRSDGGGFSGLFGKRGKSQSRGQMFDPTRAERAHADRDGRGRSDSRGRMFDPTRAARDASPRRGQPLGRGNMVSPTRYSGTRNPGQGYDKVKNLKTGGMSVAIILLRGRKDGKHYVEKRVDVKDDFMARRAKLELETLKKCRGQKHLNQLIEDSMLSRGQMSLILEYCDKLSLESKIDEALQNRGGYFREASIWNVIMGVASGLAFLHNGIQDPVKDDKGQRDWDTMCHLDLKPCNIFISSKGGEFGEPRIVLADFGCVVKYSDIMSGKEDYRRQACGTAPWYPPEGIAPLKGMKGGYGTRTDIFMLGATAHAIACMTPKVPDRPRLLSSSPCGSYYSSELKSLVRKLVAEDFNHRPAARYVAVVAREVMEEITARKARRQPHFH